MSFFEGLFAVIAILIISFIAAAFTTYWVSDGNNKLGSIIMVVTFLVCCSFGTWMIFFV